MGGPSGKTIEFVNSTILSDLHLSTKKEMCIGLLKKSFFSTRFFFLAQTPLFFQSLRIEKWKAGKENIFHLLCCYTSKVAISLWKAATFECKKGGLFPPQKKEGRRKCTRKKVETFIIFLMAKHRFSRRFMKGPFRELSTITNEFFFLRTVLG